MKTDKEIREWVKVQFGHLTKAQQREIRADMEYVRDFYEDDGITPRGTQQDRGSAIVKALGRAGQKAMEAAVQRRARRTWVAMDERYGLDPSNGSASLMNR